MTKVKLNYNETFGTKHTRDYYRGASFHFAGKWVASSHYISDDYTVDFVVHAGVLLACAKSHMSTIDNEPKDFIYDEKGTVTGVASQYWDFVLAGIVGSKPEIRINPDNFHWEIKSDVGEEWVDTGVKAKMQLEDLTPEEIRILQEPGLEVVTEFVSNVITQETGQNGDKVISQKVVTDELNNLAEDLSDEASTRSDADDTLQGNIDDLADTVSNNKDDADEHFGTIDEHLETVDQSLENLDDKIDQEIEDRQDAVSDLSNTLTGLVDDEATVRENADDTLQDNIDTLDHDLSERLDNHETAIQTINNKIPAEATASNKLADKQYVSDSIATATAVFKGISVANLTEEQFLAWANGLTTDENDYVFWNTVDSAGNAVLKRYYRSGSSWIYEYTLNNNSFTTAEWAAIQSGITADMIPSQASSSNQLADKEFVNSSIATSTANFRGTSAAGLTEEQFLTWANGLTHDDNDYIYWNTVDSAGNTVYKRYKYTGNAWVFEYSLNNSSFTANEWAAIQSGITSELVTKLTALPTNADLTIALNNKVDKVAGKDVSVIDNITLRYMPVSDIPYIETKLHITKNDGSSQIIVDLGTKFSFDDAIKLDEIESGAQVNKIETIQINGVDQTITDKTVNLPAYPTTLPASDVYAWAKASTKPSYNLSEIGNADDVKAIENLSGTSGFLKKTAANSWSLDTNTYVTARDLSEADLLTRINTLAYGIQWNKNSSTCTRIGNPLLHRTLPIQSQMKGCVEKNGEPVYWLDPSNWAYKANGDPSVLDGTDGYVRDYIPRFYGKSWDTEDYGRVMISTIKIDDTWVEIPEHFEDAYESALDRTNLKLCSVVNTSAKYRGGTNSSTYDSYEAMRSLLGKPATNFSRANARTYASNAGSELLNYNIYKWVFLWLPVIEYANFDLQTAINNNLTAEGYHQGGLGNGATTFSPWSAYNGYNPIIPCGLTNSLGNFSGQVGIDYSAFDSYSAGTVYANRYRGLECPFGDVWTNLDGIIVDANHSDYDLVYTCDDPSKYSDSITSAYTNTSRSIHTDGYVKEFDLGSTGEITAISVGGGKADYHYTGSVNSTLRTVRAGGAAASGGDAGPGCLASANGVSDSNAYFGFRTIKRIY